MLIEGVGGGDNRNNTAKPDLAKYSVQLLYKRGA